MSLPKVIPIGTKFGLLTVSGEPKRERRESGRPDYFYPCACACGNTKSVAAHLLRSGMTTSCGCLLRKGNVGDPDYTPQSTEYHSWRAMKSRCLNQRNKAYDRYGGRGITVCAQWAESFQAFLQDMGPKPSQCHQVERINNNGNYEPGNCEWRAPKQQNRNRRDTQLLTYKGETLSIADWAERKGWSRGLLYQRIRKGLTPEEALTKSQRKTARTPKKQVYY